MTDQLSWPANERNKVLLTADDDNSSRLGNELLAHNLKLFASLGPDCRPRRIDLGEIPCNGFGKVLLLVLPCRTLLPYTPSSVL